MSHFSHVSHSPRVRHNISQGSIWPPGLQVSPPKNISMCYGFYFSVKFKLWSYICGPLGFKFGLWTGAWKFRLILLEAMFKIVPEHYINKHIWLFEK